MNTPRPFDQAVAARVHARLEALAAITEEPGRITRRFLTPAMAGANAAFAGWCREAGLAPEIDAVGNLRARWFTAPGAADPGRPCLVIGSHLDTVRDAGRYDGPLGVVAALACVEQLQAWKVALPFDIEVVAFADEEGLRFQTAYLGSAYYAARFPAAWLALKDADGISLREVLAAFGSDPAAVIAPRPAPANLCGYLEVHIEQGPVLEAEACAVGVVSAIAAQTRAALTFTGKAGHAGTTPMDLREDALCAAAETILMIEATGRRIPGLRATVGQLRIEPGASNVIPALARLSLDIRHPDDEIQSAAISAVTASALDIAARRGILLTWETLQAAPAVPMDAALTSRLTASAGRFQGKAPVLVSGAGHDAAVMARLCPAAMLFVRCREGLSHHPDEYSTPADINVALAVLADAVAGFSP